MENKQPAFKTRYGRLDIAVFEHLNDDGQLWHSVSICRRYQDKQGVWRDGTFRESDLDNLVTAAGIAKDYIRSHANNVPQSPDPSRQD